MRSDPNKSNGFKFNKLWGDTEVRLFEKTSGEGENGPAFRYSPFSGNERNRLFLREHGNFEDVSLVSGIDYREDGRGFVISDFDRDGWLDLGITSPNFPRFRIVKNRIGERVGANGFVEINLIGGQTTAEPTNQWSSRDAFGAMVLVTVGDTKRMFQLSASEGLSSQNTRWIHVGLGSEKQIDSLEVHWPSGRKSVRRNIKSGERLEISERDQNVEGPVAPVTVQ